MKTILAKPSAWIPIAFSLLVVVAWGIALTIGSAPARQPDEGAWAHLFQVWLAMEFFMIVFFSVRWIPQKPKPASLILLIQIIFVFAGCFPVYYFKL